MVTEFFQNRSADMDVDAEIFKNRGADMDVDTEIFENRGADMDVDTEFFKNRGVDMDMDTAWNRCPPNSGIDALTLSLTIYCNSNHLTGSQQ